MLKQKKNGKVTKEENMYIFNRITVVPQLPKELKRLSEIANNLWWSWNTEFLQLFKIEVSFPIFPQVVF